MKIELKNLKHSPSLSEETNAFTATVYVDGKPLCHASNHGTGGPDRYHAIAPKTHADIDAVNAWLKTNRPADTSHGITIEHDLEIEVGDLLDAQVRSKALTRLVRTKIVVLDENNGDPFLSTYPAKYKPTAENLAKVAKTLKTGQTVVNGNPAVEDRALKLV